MKITMIGSGYVGLVSGACFADFGVNVTCVDIDESKIKSLNAGEIPFHEPGLKELVNKNVKADRLLFTDNVSEAIKKSQVVFLCVGTPQGDDGSADLQYIYKAAETFADSLKDSNDYKIVVTKSTVPVGTAKEIEKIILGKGISADLFDVVSNPEFLREGSSIEDFMRPNRVVIGTNSKKAVEVMKQLYSPLYINETPFIITTPENSELIKYAANAFLATKISFINEIANLSDHIGTDVNVIAKAIGLDKRIGSKFLHAGPGYGGSCFPKDTNALSYTAKESGYDFKIVNSVIEVNKNQRDLMIKKIKDAIGGDGNVKGKTISVLGLSFKPNTDDIRDSASIDIIKILSKEGAHIKTTDPEAMDNARAELKGYDVEFNDDVYETIKNADAVVVATEWNQYRNLDLPKVKEMLKKSVFVDLRNIYDPQTMRQLGFVYKSVGRP